jgi:hypothetical protein
MNVLFVYINVVYIKSIIFNMATKKKKVLDISTAKVADGALAPRAKSAYEICGISTFTYKHRTLAEYQTYLHKLNLIQLQDEAYEHGITAGTSIPMLIDRLERQYCKERNKFASVGVEAKKDDANEDVHAKAVEIMRRGA